MKKFITSISICLFLAGVTCFAQEEVTDYQKEIIEQVWKPFKQSYEARDSNTFKSIHTDDMLRITDMEIRTGKEYKAEIATWRKPPEGTSITIDFALESSNDGGDVAYQVGYYRVTYTSAKEPASTYYGQFHVVLKKIDGVWKIAQDFDTGMLNGKEVGAEHFENASLMVLSN